MNIKNLSIGEKIVDLALTGAIALSTISGIGLYYNYEKVYQSDETEYSIEDVRTSLMGTKSYIFGIGEHKIIVSRNDFFPHEPDMFYGYKIESVETSGWRDNSKITYVNTLPVTVDATEKKNGELVFNSFGEVVIWRTPIKRRAKL